MQERLKIPDKSIMAVVCMPPRKVNRKLAGMNHCHCALCIIQPERNTPTHTHCCQSGSTVRPIAEMI